MALEGTPTIWVRRCSGCGDDDLRAGFGHRSIIDDRPWRCPHCLAPAWDPAAVALPDNDRAARAGRSTTRAAR